MYCIRTLFIHSVALVFLPLNCFAGYFANEMVRLKDNLYQWENRTSDLHDVEDIVNKLKDKIEYNYQNGKRISNKYSKFHLMKQQEQKVDYILEKIINE